MDWGLDSHTLGKQKLTSWIAINKYYIADTVIALSTVSKGVKIWGEWEGDRFCQFFLFCSVSQTSILL